MADMQNLVERLERAVGRLEAVSHTSDMHCGYGDSPSKGAVPYVQAFDSLLANPVAEYLKMSKEIGGDVQKHAEMVHTGLKLERALLELEGKKWRVENQENVSNLVIDDTELKQVAYIYKCVNTTLQIKGKINSITVDNCKKLGLVFDDVVGIVEIINSRDVKVQVMGKVPTISINKTDGCHAYLSKNSLDCEIVSAKSSEMNVLIPTEGGDFNEFPVPEQFKTLWNGQKLVTTVTEIAG